MRNSNWSLLIVWAGLGILLYGVPGHAQIAKQTKKPEQTIKLEQNPFDFVQEIVENNGQYQQGQNLAKNIAQGATPKDKYALKFHKKSNGSPQQAETIYNSLVQKYGPPKSIRGQSHVWDIENPEKDSAQADMVTVVLKMDMSGSYELKMDRDRGENGLATWDATRLKKAAIKPSKQKKANRKLVLQVDND